MTDYSNPRIAPHTWYYVDRDPKIEIRQPITPNSIRFHGGEDNTEVGRFEIVDGEMRFRGCCDATTKVMIKYFVQQFNDRIEADKKALQTENAVLFEQTQSLEVMNAALKAQVEQLQFELNVVNSRE